MSKSATVAKAKPTNSSLMYGHNELNSALNLRYEAIRAISAMTIFLGGITLNYL